MKFCQATHVIWPESVPPRSPARGHGLWPTNEVPENGILGKILLTYASGSGFYRKCANTL